MIDHILKSYNINKSLFEKCQKLRLVADIFYINNVLPLKTSDTGDK
jgi:hypothetical protein